MQSEQITTKLTTKELLDEYLDTSLDMQMSEDGEEKEALQAALAKMEETLLDKVDNIEHVIVRKNERTEVLKAQKKVYEDVVSNFKKKLEAEAKAYSRLETLIITIVENVGNQEGTKTTLENNGFKYTAYHSPGSLEITDLDNIPQEYNKMKVEVDKARLRKDVIANGDTDYANVPRVKRLKVT